MKKSALIDEMTAGLTELQREEYEERAAILEFEGGMTRECAEFAAMALMYRSYPLEFMGLRILQLPSGQVALSDVTSGDDGAEVPDRCPLELLAVVRSMGGVVVLAPPKSEENGVSKTEEF